MPAVHRLSGSRGMDIVILGPAHPYRGGLPQIMHAMAEEYIGRGDSVRIYTFSLQYPAFLFPGKNQYTDSPAPEGLHIERVINTCNPLRWVELGLRLRRERPDMILMKYWTPYMAPCFGTICRLARMNSHTKVICQIDNVEPHEHHFFDHLFNRWYLGSVDGFVYMSEQVHMQLQRYTSVPQIFSPHPMFESFGQKIPREEALQALGLSPEYRYLLFFGLIRHYKGLDMLLGAFSRISDPRLRLIVAGESYEKEGTYDSLLDALGERVIRRLEFVPDSMIKYYFSAADALVLPYRTATQSGVTQIAYNFYLPIIATRVGGLPEIVADGRSGLLCEPEEESILQAIERFYKPGVRDSVMDCYESERSRFSWQAMCDSITRVFKESGRH